MEYPTQPKDVAASPATEGERSINSLVDSFVGITSRLQDAVNYARNIGDSIHGPVPMPVSSDKPDHPPVNLLTKIERRRKEMTDLIDVLENQLRRIGSGL